MTRPETVKQLPPLTPGDRMPDFIFPDQAGTRRQFYQEVTGGPILFLALGDPGPVTAAAWQALLAAESALRETGAQLFALIGGAGTLPAPAGFPVFLDREGRLLKRLLSAQAGAGVQAALYLLDPNQRMLSALRDGTIATHVTTLAGEIAAWRDRQEPRQVLAGGAPVLVLPGVLEPALCDTLIAAWREEHREGGFSTGTVNTYDQSRKKTLEHIVSDPRLERQVAATLARRIGPELVKVFNYAAPFRFEGHIVMRYGPERQDFFGLHRDNLRQENPRRFAMSLNLNDDFEGGELCFPEYSPHGVAMPAGAAAVFSCALLHEAKPVRSGERFVLTNFFCDPDQPGPDGIPEQRRQKPL